MCAYAFTMQHCTYMYVQYYSATTKKKILSYMTTCMDLEGIMISVREDKYCTRSLICGIKKKIKVIGKKIRYIVTRGRGWNEELIA